MQALEQLRFTIVNSTLVGGRQPRHPESIHQPPLQLSYRASPTKDIFPCIGLQPPDFSIWSCHPTLHRLSSAPLRRCRQRKEPLLGWRVTCVHVELQPAGLAIRFPCRPRRFEHESLTKLFVFPSFSSCAVLLFFLFFFSLVTSSGGER